MKTIRHLRNQQQRDIAFWLSVFVVLLVLL